MRNSTKNRWLGALGLTLSLVLAVALAPSFGAEGPIKLKKFEIGSGSVGGIYYVAGNAIANLLQKSSIFSAPVTCSATEGSAENIALLDQGRIEAGTVAANAMYTAWQGGKPYKKQHRDLRILMRTFPNPTVFFALESSGITKMSQLKGKRIGAGSGPSTWDILTGPFLEAHGVDYKNDVKRVYGNWEDLCNQVNDGLLDAAIGNVSGGTSLMPAIFALATSKKVNFLEWDPKAMDELSAKYPYFSKTVVQAGALPGRTADYPTVDIGSQLLVAKEDLPDDAAYAVVKTIHQKMAELVGTAKFFAYVSKNPEFMTKKLGEAQFHPGAVKYWKEVGLWRE